MPRRSLVTLSLGALLFAAASVHGAVIQNRGDACGNADTCADNGTCIGNFCADSADGVINGNGNSCSATDCCGEGLTCIDAAGLQKCVDNSLVADALTKITCTGTPQSASGVVQSSSGTDMSSSGTDMSSTTDPTLSSSGAGSSGTDVSSSGTDLSSSGVATGSSTTIPIGGSDNTTSSTGTDSSSSGVVIGSSSTGSNTTSSTGTNTGSAGVGQDCDAQTCCSGSNVCYAIGKKCGPSVSSLPTISCGGSNPNTSDYTGSGDSCNNNQGCSNSDETCVSNTCVNTQGQGLPNGLGNTCSADDCCPSGLSCYQEANRCAPSVSNLGTVTCTATGGPSGGQTIGNNPSGVGNDNAAGMVAAHPIVAAGLVLASMAISALFM